jgi:iron(III) transport system ATP-binding protein
MGPVRIRLPHRQFGVGPASLAVRPQSVAIGHTTQDGAGLSGRIAKAAYLGSHMEYTVVIDGVADNVFVVDGNVQTPFPVGSSVGVAIHRDGAVLVAERD